MTDQEMIGSNSTATDEQRSERSLTDRDKLRAKLRQRKAAASWVSAKIVRQEGEQKVLSFSQQRLWLMDQLMGASAVYNICFAIRFSEGLDVEVLDRCVARIVERHEVLRSRFVGDGQSARIVIDAAEGFRLRREVVGSEQEIRTIWRGEREYLFDISGEALFRARLLEEEQGTYVLVVTMHHIVADAWSLGVFFKELVSLYNARAQADALEPLAIQFSDYARWQREWLNETVLSQQVGYWKKQLAGMEPLLMLPTDRARPAQQSFRGATEVVHISAQMTQALKELSSARGATLFMSLLSAFAILLGRYAGQKDVAIGTPIANRTRRETEELIGFFVNTLVMRTDLSGEPSFEELLQKVRSTAMEAYAHQDVPFEHLVEVLNPERNLSYSPLFQVMFVLQNAPMPDLSLDSVRFSRLHDEALDGFSRFDLTLSLGEGEEGLRGVFEYNTDLFDRSTIQRLGQHYVRLLQEVLSTPGCVIDRLNVLSDEEKAEQLSWNDTAEGWELGCIHDAVAAQARRTPAAVALREGQSWISYEVLENKARDLAMRLRQAGVQSGERVGVCLERSIEMVIGMLGVLKAGGTYVPIDPSAPVSRIEYIIEDAQLRKVLSARGIEAPPRYRDTPQCQWWQLDALDLSESAVDVESEVSGVNQDHAAYVIYTSGSTGAPKAVLGRHASVMNRLRWMSERYPLEPEEVLCQKTSISFVDHVAEIFQALSSGSELVIVPKSCVQSAAQLLAAIDAHGITRLTVVPSLLHALLAEESAQVCASVRLLICSGEALVMRQWEAFERRFPNAQLLNLYGSSEVGADVTSHEARVHQDGAVLIGRAIANTQIYVLSAAGELLPRGAVGELFVGGEGLAQGYLNRGGLTAQRFVPDRFSGRVGARLYRTGDFVRYQRNGELEYVGRIDDQVKIRGFRIELGEVDVALRSHPGVDSAVTAVHLRAQGEAQLVAYVVPRQPADRSRLSAQLKEHLKERLPQYMMPSLIQFVSVLPMNASGKIDRRALQPVHSDEQGYEAPEGEYETLLAALWGEVLQCQQVGRQDNFFELGGHSLLVTQLISRIRDRFKVELPLLSIFEHQTLAAQAQFIIHSKAGQTERAALQSIPALDPSVRCGPQPLSFSQQRLWFLDQLIGPNPSYNIPLALSLRGSLDVEVLERSVNYLLERHESLRTRFMQQQGQAHQVLWPHEPLSLKVELLEDEQQLHRAVKEERMYCFELCAQRLIRVRLLRVQGHAEHVLLITIHHIIADGWSIGIFFRELADAYRAYQANEPPMMERLRVQYLDFAAWQRSWLDGAVLQEQLSYWRERLAGLPPLLNLPTDRARPLEQSYRGSGVRFSLKAPLLQALQALSRRHGVTLFMTLLSAYALLLRRYSGQTDIAVGTAIAQRTRREIEHVIGFFANTLVMRNDLSGNPSFIELLERTREMALSAYAHQDIPFEQLVDALNPTRSLSHSPLFQVMFVLQNAPMQVHTLESLSIAPVLLEEEQSNARFDLHLAMGEVNGELVGRLEYNTDLFDRARIEQLVVHFENLLQGIVESPVASVDSYEFITAEERHWQLTVLNATQAQYPRETTLKALFEAQVERSPDAVALEFQGEKVTFAELNLRANKLAHYLIHAGARPDECIGLLAQRSIELVVGIYGILKAGCAYLPLDPDYPQERINHIVAEANVRLVVSHQGLARGLCPTTSQVLSLGSPLTTELLERHSGANPRLPDLLSSHLAYVIYTSGSTGKPKGVMVEHRAVVNRILWMQREYGLTPTDVVLQKTPFSFDVSVWEFVWPLIVGAKLVIAAPHGHRDPDYLIDLIRQSQITTLHFVPSMLQGILSLHRWQECESVRRVFCSGEALPRELVNSFYGTGTRSELHNLYGPTEAAIDVSYWNCSNMVGSSVPIGRPIQNIQLYVVDERMKLVPQGTIGELLIAGEGLARGYINRDDLTSEKFIAHPFAGAPDRVYRTGDLVRLLQNGAIEYMGRADNQVKINGFRIELGEIESLLDAMDCIEKAVVLAVDDRGFTRLAAYLVPKTPGLELPIAQIQSRLAASLPHYMVPQDYVPLDSIPLTLSGKLDKNRLPKLVTGERTRSQFQAPTTELQHRLAAAWKSNLGIEQVGITDNYFSMGGDSIRSIALVTHARTLGLDFKVKDLFTHPTIASLAEAISTGGLDETQTEIPEAFDLITEEERTTLLQSFS